MTATQNYYAPPAHKPPLDRLSETVKSIKDKALASAEPMLNSPAAMKMRSGAEKAYGQARKHPVPIILGVAAVGLITALLMNRRTREGGLMLADKAWKQMRR